MVWIPRYRKRLLVGPVADRLKALFAEISSQYDFEILAVEVLGMRSMHDHVHLFVSAPPRFSPSDLVRYFKGSSSRRLMQEFPALRRQYWGKCATLWAEGYYVGTAGHVSADIIKPYIEECQKD